MKNLSTLLLGLSTVSLVLCSTSANAQNLPVNATVAELCTVTPAGTPGTMVLGESGELEEGDGAEFAVLTTRADATITITPPQSGFTTIPIGTNAYAGTPTFSYRYTFDGAAVIPSTELPSTDLTIPGLYTGTLYSSATTENGAFTNGAYVATYTVTCS